MNIEKLLLILLFVAISYYPLCAIVGFISFIKRYKAERERRVKLIVNERDGCCKSIHIEYTPTEALIINEAMRRYVSDDEVNEKNRAIMEQMLNVKPIFVDVAEGREK